MPFILAHDLGTTGNKATLFDEAGDLVASHLENSLIPKRIGPSKIQPMGGALFAFPRALLAESRISPREIACFRGIFYGGERCSKPSCSIRKS